MKYLQLKLSKKQRKQIQNLAKLANKSDGTRPYLQYVEFLKNGDNIKISATNAVSLVDLDLIAHDCENLEDGFKFQIHSKHLLEIKDEFLQFDFQDKIKIFKGSYTTEVDYYTDYVELDRVRKIKESYDSEIIFSLKQLTQIMKAMDSDLVKIKFNNGTLDPIVVNEKSLLMPIR